MKKYVIAFVMVILGLLLGIFLTGCFHQKSNQSSWLNGTWYSEEWQSTIVFGQSKENWLIKSDPGKDEIAKESADSTGKNIILQTKEASYVIEKVDDRHLIFYLDSSDGNGKVGLTKSVEFVKQK
ncbi:hypothetical protein EH331_14680 [Enterococcus faecalis]|nr:hypothetical protein [Enterococcus faecalis]